ncbi:Inosine/uridine-preferring nucleoside hydrolase domain-containing protein [Gautieria morchelliformis]|nr:Inosine/uridine-preferring nucleoside hydrolase domain-containing protein [Gautieria morchelliformis]
MSNKGKVPKRLQLEVDTDPGVDDTLAILLALASPELEIKAITINFGNTDVEHSHNNILKIWHALHRHFDKHPEDRGRFPIFSPGYNGDLPFLACGSTGPLAGELMLAEYFHGRDGLSDISIRHPELSAPVDWHPELLRLTDQSAVDLSLELIRSYPPRSITYIALGPLTNLAWMMRTDAVCVRERIGRVITMGGAFEAPGNVTPVAEFNFYADPFAVKELLHPQEPYKGLPLDRFILLPLDVTTSHELPFAEYKKWVDPGFSDTRSPSEPNDKAPLTHFTSSFLERTAEVMRGFGVDAVQLHDPITVWCAICNPPVQDEAMYSPPLHNGWVICRRTFQVERTGEMTRGMLVIDRRVDEGNYELGDNRARVQALKDSSIQGRSSVQLKSKEELQKSVEAEGVIVVIESPGPQELLRLILKRIWGVEGA